MNQHVIDILRRWHTAHKTAEENPQLILNAKTAEECTRVSDLCAERMQKCYEADAELWHLVKSGDKIPILLKLFYKADKQKGCTSCWLSSSSNKKHKRCAYRIARWFGYRDALMIYIDMVYMHYRIGLKPLEKPQ